MNRLTQGLQASAPWLLAAATFALAYFSPIDEARSDPAIALLATQSLLDHQTLRLDAYQGDPSLAYDLETDYRIRRHDGSFTYYSHGISVLSLPAVWVANQFGYHMLDQQDEFALQNLLSALCCGLLAALFYSICRTYLGAGASLGIAAVSIFGSSLMSTLATGLWNVGYAILLLALAVLHLLRREAGMTHRLGLGYLAFLAVLAFLSRPTAAFAVLAAMLALPPYGIAGKLRQRRVWLPVTFGLFLLTAALIALDLSGLIPRYYSPLRLTPQSPLSIGLQGTLVSPSRGLLIYSPFLIPMVLACLWGVRELVRNWLFRLAAIWAVLQLLAISTKGTWWGGHSFGPRLLAEILLPAVLATCLAWRQLERRGSRRIRLGFAAAYLVCGLVAIYIHSYQGLFNPHARRWNWTPNVDLNPRLAFDWRNPQFLATDSSLEWRLFEHASREAGGYSLGYEVAFDDGVDVGALLRYWHIPEPGWRWSRGRSPEIVLRLGELPTADFYLFEMRAGSLGHQQVSLEVNGTPVGQIEMDGPARDRAFAIDPTLLRPRQDNELRFDVPGASATETDSRVLGIALHSFRLSPVSDFGGVHPGDESLFGPGFSTSEGLWRWTDDHRAVIDYPVTDTSAPGSTGIDTLELTASAMVYQPVGVRINGVDIGVLNFRAGFDEVISPTLRFDPNLLRPFRINQIELTLPEARATPEDARLLGIAFRRLELLSSPSVDPPIPTSDE